jgi:hypothetical protein
MNINDLTIGQAKELSALFSSESPVGLNSMVGNMCVIRTYSAGVWFGRVIQKSGSEVIIDGARRLWRWHAASGITLSEVALHGIQRDKSKIAEALDGVWLNSIELLPTTEKAAKSIAGADSASA